MSKQATFEFARDTYNRVMGDLFMLGPDDVQALIYRLKLGPIADTVPPELLDAMAKRDRTLYGKHMRGLR